MANNPLVALTNAGQSVWYDQIERRLVVEGELRKMIEEDALRGLTSNPTIFEKAIGGSPDYEEQLRRLVNEGKSVDEIYEAIVAEDIRSAADVFRPVYHDTNGGDGYVSLEVKPAAAFDTAETVREALHFESLIDRPNLMVKIPATADGIPAIEESIANGININVTLIFSRAVYAKVIDAYMRGLERRAEQGKAVDGIASVASFFVSRIDSKVDKAIEEKMKGADESTRARLSLLLGKIAIANAKLAYQLFLSEFGSERFAKLREKGARRQRPLWASTSTKNPAYRDVIYVEELIGPDTVNTLPPATFDAFRDHGRVEMTLEKNVDQAKRQLEELEALGISLEAITDELTREGVKSFADSFDSLMKTIENRRAEVGV